MSEQPAHPQRPRRRWRRRALRTLLLLAALPCAAAVLFQCAVWFWPYPAGLDRPPRAGTWIEDRAGTPLAAFVAEDAQWRIPLARNQVSEHLLKAIVAVEDARFYEHGGVDWKSVMAAAGENARSARIVRGASTISMQVHRLRDPRPRGIGYKLEQAIRAEQIERAMSKEQILLEYVNRAPFGGNLVGAGSASWRYFGRPCAELSLGQAALLAGIPQNPNRYRPDRHPDRATQRRTHVLNRMLATGAITPAQHAAAMAEPIDAAWRPLPQMSADAHMPMSDAAMPTLLRLKRAYPGAALRTTLDAAVQRQAARMALEHLERLAPSGATAIAVVVMDIESAEVRAAVSIAEQAKRVDLTTTPRSTGSVLKPFIYASAFDLGLATPASIVHDTPMAWPGYAPGNFDGAFRGAMRADDALAESRNIPALLLLSHVGVDRACGLMGSAGLRTLAARPDRYGLSLAIGGAEASPMEVAEAYATLARGGTPIRSRLIESLPPPVRWGRAGERALVACQEDPLPSPPPEYRGREQGGQPTSLLSPRSCAQTLAAIAHPTRTAAISPEASRLNAAWKTGTSSGQRDAWCAAVTRQWAVVVWVGNPAGQGANCLVGQEAAAPLALRLIGSLGGQPARWAAPAERPSVAGVIRLPLSRRLTLLSPANGLEVVYNPDIPAAQQKLLLRALPAQHRPEDGGLPHLWWFIDGQPIGATQGDDSLFWPPAPGRHEVRVVDAEGRSALSTIHVR